MILGIGIIIGLFLGYQFQRINNLIKVLQQSLVKEPEEKPDSVVLDPSDLGQMVQLEHKRQMRELNPDEDL